jgi:SAM-dependent methyltransferase
MLQQTPLAVATAHTVEFIVTNTPSSATLLEIGCGRGDVAAALQRLGYVVTGVESGDEELRIAHSKGVRVIAGEWPNVSSPSTDVVVFSRSLHHMKDLAGAIDTAHRALIGPRRLLIEDFDFSAADGATVEWLVSKVGEAAARGFLRPHVDEFATRVAAASDPLKAWSRDHDHHLHDADRILTSVIRRFVVDERTDVPYLFRYLVPVVIESSNSWAWLRDVFHEEQRRGETRGLKLIGRRIVASAA